MEFAFRSRRTQIAEIRKFEASYFETKTRHKMPLFKAICQPGRKTGSNETFVLSEKIFEDYCQAVAVWTDGNSLHGQTKYEIPY